MGKNKPGLITSKKLKQPDFQKVKFKVGKKLPKNLNETRATFKAKTLILKQQFQEKEGPVSHRNLSWKELLAHLGHLNQSVKMDALNSLKEMILKNDDLIRLEFSNLLENLCPLFTDREYKVRENAINLFKTLILLPIFKENQNQLLKPFYGLITVYLSCAMTHISDNIQYSSLKLLDILVEYSPELVKKNAYSIFDNFIEQISKASVKNDNKRVLKNDPYKLTSTQSWRYNVLNRLQKILSIISKEEAHGQPKSETKVLKTNNWILNTNNFNDDTERVPLQICKKLMSKKSITDLTEFYQHYFKIVAPLLIECWIEAKPENKNSIDTSESLGIMYLVISIYNIMMDNLNLTIQDLSQFIKVPRSSTIESHVESLFLSDFPYALAENYDPENDQNKKLFGDNFTQISSTSLNLLICKFCSSSLLTMNENKCLEILTYCISSLDTQTSLNSHELQIILKLSKNIFENFRDPKIIKPFLTGLISFLDENNNRTTTKWNIFEFLSKELYANENLLSYDNLYLSFFKKIVKFLTSNLKEKKFERIETVFDWIRNLTIRKKSLVQLVEHEYINILNITDFKSQDLNENTRKKLIELLYSLPKINRYLFTKLAFLILSNNLSMFNVNQILSILKLKSENGSCDESDYLMFLMHLINGYSSFELSDDTRQAEDFYSFENAIKFNNHVELCETLESFVSSHKNSDTIINLLLSTSLPMFSKLEKGVYTTTVLGSLCLISQIDNLNSLGSTYDQMIPIWLSNVFFWTSGKYFDFKSVNIDTENDDKLACVEILFKKLVFIMRKSDKILVDLTNQIASLLNLYDDLNNVKTVFLIINFLIKNFSTKLKSLKQLFISIHNMYQYTFNNLNYVWWHEYGHLIKSL